MLDRIKRWWQTRNLDPPQEPTETEQSKGHQFGNWIVPEHCHIRGWNLISDINESNNDNEV